MLNAVEELDRHDQDLRRAVARADMAAKLQRDLDWLQRALHTASRRAQELEQDLEAERRDVIRATEGLSAMWFRLLGDQEQRIEREQADELRVAALYRGVLDDRAFLRMEREQIAARLAELGDVTTQLQRAISEKERALVAAGGPAGHELAALAREAGTLEEQQREIDEALDTGDVAVAEVDGALAELQSAGNWGLVDIVGGGLVTSMIKHDRIARAQSRIARVQHALYAFHRELDDVTLGLGAGAGVQIGGVAFAFDVVFDNVISDFFVQSKINTSLDRLTSVRATLASTCHQLQQAGEASRARLGEVDLRRHELINAT